MHKQQETSARKPPVRYNVNRTLSNYHPNDQKNTPHSPRTEALEILEEVTHEPKKRFGWKKRILLLFTILLLPPLIVAGLDIRNASGASKKLFGTSNVTGALVPTMLDTTSNRTNIMLVGYSADDPGHAGALLTDSIMVVSINKQTKTGYMLSVPRDLYVDIPDYGSAKINEAYQAGERQSFSDPDYPAGGVGLLQKVVSDNFNIPIHYYVIINYAAVREITDALDGITVTIESPESQGIYDPNFKTEEGGPLKLANGPQLLDGQTALRLTRARGSTAGSYGFPQSDFNRTQNQQKVFAAIKAEIDPQLILDPRHNKPFFDAVANNVQTDIKLNEVIPLLRAIRSVPDTSLKQVNLRDVDGVNLLGSYTTRSGQSALVPAAGVDDYTEIQAAINKLP